MSSREGLDSAPGAGGTVASMSETTTSLMSIGAFSRRARLSLKALRLYDRLGLLPPASVDPETGYRYYVEAQVDHARLIGLLRRLKMPLERIGLVLDLPADAAVTELRLFWAETEQDVEVRRRLVAILERHLEGRGEAMYAIQTRQVPEQQVLSITRALTVEDLPGFIMDSFVALAAHVERAGARQVAAPFVIYHGEVNTDSDGPVEACQPFDGTVPPGDGMQARIEPAHAEAFTTLTKAEVSFPGVLEAYNAVERWIDESGREMKAPPREVYFTTDEVADDDPFCDVAYPIG